jgi:ABC-type phosphate transport system substrate-binding protein
VLLASVAVGGLVVGGQRAASQTDPATVSGEGGTFDWNLIDQLLSDGASTFSSVSDSSGDALNGTYDPLGSDVGMSDFAHGNADFAVTEFPMSADDAAAAASIGRSYAYVPIDAMPVTVVAMVDANDSLDAAQAQWYSAANGDQIELTADQLEQAMTGNIGGWFSAAPTGGDVNQITPNHEPSIVLLTQGGSGTSPDALTTVMPETPSADTYALTSYFLDNPQAAADWVADLPSIWPAGATIPVGPTDTWQSVLSIKLLDDKHVQNDLAFLDSTTGNLSEQLAQWCLGCISTIPGDWLQVDPDAAGEISSLPTVALQNDGAYVQPTLAATEAAENDSTIDSTTNLVTINSTSDPNAYPMVMMDYLLVPTSGLSAAKATALANFIGFILSPTGTSDIENFGAAPVNSTMQALDQSVVTELQAEATAAATTTTSTSSTTSSTSTSTSSTSTSSTSTTSASTSTSSSSTSTSSTSTSSTSTSSTSTSTSLPSMSTSTTSSPTTSSPTTTRTSTTTTTTSPTQSTTTSTPATPTTSTPPPPIDSTTRPPPTSVALTGPTGTGPPGLHVVRTWRVPAGGASLHAVLDALQITVVVPPADVATSGAAALELTTAPLGVVPAGSLAGKHDLAVLGISLERNSEASMGSFPAPIKVALSGAGLTGADSLLVYLPSRATFVPAASAVGVVSGVRFGANGSSFDVDADPVLAIEAPALTSSKVVTRSLTTRSSSARRHEARSVALRRSRSLVAKSHSRRTGPSRRVAEVAPSQAVPARASDSGVVAGAGNSSSTLAYTGIALGPLLGLGGVLLGAGALLGRRARRRSARSS